MSAEPPDNPSDLGRRLVKARRVVQGVCRVCRAQFTGAPNRRYCCDRCRWHHYRHRERVEAFVLRHRLAAVRVGSANVFLDREGHYWVQFECLRGPKEGEPGYPADPAPKVLEASYRALFQAFAAGERGRGRGETDDAEG
jgi:hypothetical protein